MRPLLEILRRMVREEVATIRRPQLGIVTDVHARADENSNNNYEVDVRLKYDDLVLKKVPVAVEFSGLMALPRRNELVLVDFVNGDLQQPFVAHRFYTDMVQAPVGGENELIIEHRYGDNEGKNIIKMTGEGAIQIMQNVSDNGAAMEICIDNQGNMNIGTVDDRTKSVTIECRTFTIKCEEMAVNGIAKIDNGTSSTTIDGNTITGSTGS